MCSVPARWQNQQLAKQKDPTDQILGLMKLFENKTENKVYYSFVVNGLLFRNGNEHHREVCLPLLVFITRKLISTQHMNLQIPLKLVNI